MCLRLSLDSKHLVSHLLLPTSLVLSWLFSLLAVYIVLFLLVFGSFSTAPFLYTGLDVQLVPVLSTATALKEEVCDDLCMLQISSLACRLCDAALS